MSHLSVTRFVPYALVFTMMLAGSSAFASTIGEDGLHKQDWFSLTFKDVAEDISDANAEGKRLVFVFEQRGCIYCAKLHETILSDPEVSAYLQENYHVVQFNLFGDEEVTDMDGEVLIEKTAATKWDVLFTPTMVFMPEEPVEGVSVSEAAVGKMPGAFGKLTFLHLFQWVKEKGYEGEEHFQKYHARRIEERRTAGQTVEE
ncbi:MAG: thioredoxin family protein [Granulosicoccus sp.]